MRRQLLPAFAMVVVMTVLTGLVYTFAFTGFAQVVAPDTANGSRVQVDGKDVGSEYIGQAWVDKKGAPLTQYFQSRPSAAINTTDNGYDPTLSLGSNWGPANPDLLKAVSERVEAYRELNGLDESATIPVDAVTASASGLDPDISIANARLQAPRIADERGLSLPRVNQLIDEHTDDRTFGILGEKRVNVLKLNLALDRAAPQ
ncbi:MAG: K(+)-transporting ATPase subunit C [Acidimicrobiia bacterium]